MLQYSKKTIIILLLIAVMLYIAAIIYSYSYKHSEDTVVFNADTMTELVIDAKYADIIIDRGNSSEISIKGLRTKELTHETSGNTHRIAASSKGLLKERKIALRVTLPASSIKSISINAEAGDIALSNAKTEHIAIAAGSGAIDIESSQGDIELKSSNGDIKLIDTVSNAISISSKNGDIDIIGIIADSASIESTTGDAFISPSALNTLAISLTSGDIELDLDEEPAHIAWNTASGTFYVNDEELSEAKSFDGKGSLIVKASTASGDLELSY